MGKHTFSSHELLSLKARGLKHVCPAVERVMRAGLWLDFVNPQPLAARLLRPDPPLRYSSQASQVGLTPSKAGHPIFGVSEACGGDPSSGALLPDPRPSSWDGSTLPVPHPMPRQ